MRRAEEIQVRRSFNGAQRPCAGALSGFDPSSPNAVISSQSADKCNFLDGGQAQVIVQAKNPKEFVLREKLHAPSKIVQSDFLWSCSKILGVL